MLPRCRRTLVRCIVLCIPCLAFAGQSIVVNGSPRIPVADPIFPQKQSWRVEFQIHNWTIPRAGVYNAVLFEFAGTGVKVLIAPEARLATELSDQVTPAEPCFSNLAGRANVLIRLQRDTQAMRFSCEIWNYDGTGYQNEVMPITVLRPRASGGGTIGAGAEAAMGFFRVATTLLPLGGRPPTTADGGDWTELKFDRSLKDSSGHNRGGAGTTGSYINTPDQIVVALPKTAGAPSWSPWTSLRAGFPAHLDASASYSLADASSAVSCVWQQLKGPATLSWTGKDTLTPTVEGLIFGTYEFALKVVDAAGNTATATLETGAVATDDNGVVVNANPDVDRIFGPMIAFGKNPWGYADERALTATRLRMAAYDALGLNPPPWTKPGPGTVTYTFNGVGPVGAVATRLTAAITAIDKTIAVADASVLDLSSLPARILLGGIPREEVRICSASATKGPATLTICYDGRSHEGQDSYRSPPQAWPVGTLVGQVKVKGTGTGFLSFICPAGPGPDGRVVYKDGTIRLTAGTQDATGAGTNWNAASDVRPGNIVRVSATHGGAPFVFWSYIDSVADPMHLKLSRPFPADADTAAYAYSVIRTDSRTITLHYKRPSDGVDNQMYFQTSGCETDTDVYLFMGHDIPSLDGTLQKDVKYSYMDGYGYTSAFGPNFYGEDLAHRALYYRSGWTPALQAARVFGDNFVDSPQIAGGDAGGIPLLIGGGVIGGFAATILDVSDPRRPAWSSLRGFAKWGMIGNLGCNDGDSRDDGYQAAWLTLAAGYDPDPVQRAKWQAGVGQLLNRDVKCKGPDNSWSNGFLWNNGSVPLSLTHGSPVATGHDIPRSMCYGIANGVIDVTRGSAKGTGTGFVRGRQIAVTGTRNGSPYTGFFEFSINPDGSITMAALWPGDSGRATWVIENNDNLNTIAVSNEDPQLRRNWACTWNGPSQITLDRAWDGPTETGAHLFSYGLSGFGQQPYMLGIKLMQMKLASQIPAAPFAEKYAELAKEGATWIHDVGYDPVTQGMHYGRVMQACEPQTFPPPGSTFGSRTPGCNNGLDPGAIRTARVLTAEASQALRVYYESNPTPEAKAWGDTAYGSVWGNPVYTAAGFYSDPNFVKDENSNLSLGAYKWTGFFLGMGMAHQWPAVRLGGVAPPRNRTVSLEVKQGAGSAARIWVTAPSGEAKAYSCGTALSCDVIVDDRQGSHWYVVEYLSGDGKVLSRSDPALLAVAK